MAEAKFTKGPYEQREREGEHGAVFYVAKGIFILADDIHGTLAAPWQNNAEERKATAQLFAAAPLLYAALKAMMVMMDMGGKPQKLDEALTWRANDEKARSMADAALAAVEGTEK